MIYNTLHKLKISHTFSRNFFTERSLLFRLVYGLLKKINFTRTIRRNGKPYKVLLKDGVGIMNFISKYESWFDEILPILIEHEKPVFIDIGANTGQTILKVLPHFPNTRYFAIEPNPSCVKYLKDLCEKNEFDTVNIRNCGLSDSEGETELLLRYQDDILATTTPSFRKYTKYATKVKVPVTTGDSLLQSENLEKVSIIKIDVEGGEAKVIKGLLSTIRTFEPYIICEILPIVSKDPDVSTFRTSSAQQILSMLHDLNYTVFNILSKEEIKRIEDLSDSLESSNYLFVPAGKEFS